MSPDEDLDTGGEDVSDVPAPTFQSMTGEMVDAYFAGDKATAAEIAAERDAMVKDWFEHDPNSEQRVQPNVFSTSEILGEVRSMGERGQLVAAEMDRDPQRYLGMAMAYIKATPGFAESFEKAPDRAKPDLVQHAYETAVSNGMQPEQVFLKPDGVSSLPTDRLAAQREIDALLAEFPPGTRDYASPYVQTELARLYRQVTSGEPIVGMQGRIV